MFPPDLRTDIRGSTLSVPLGLSSSIGKLILFLRRTAAALTLLGVFSTLINMKITFKGIQEAESIAGIRGAAAAAAAGESMLLLLLE